MTEFTSGLVYQDEPGALNEAFSDIMAIAAEFYTLRAGQGPQRGPNFLIGEDVTRVAPGYHPIGAEPDRRPAIPITTRCGSSSARRSTTAACT